MVLVSLMGSYCMFYSGGADSRATPSGRGRYNGLVQSMAQYQTNLGHLASSRQLSYEIPATLHHPHPQFSFPYNSLSPEQLPSHLLLQPSIYMRTYINKTK